VVLHEHKRETNALALTEEFMNKEEIISYCLTYPDTYEDYPFDENWAVIRHRGNKKIFALIYNNNGQLCVNLKCEPSRADFYRSIFEDVHPGYHMNKMHWNTVRLDGNMLDEDLFEMVHHSFQLTKPKIKKNKTVEGNKP
jgi:predicted DNA-binding protein (MmcQ/YjbR family)